MVSVVIIPANMPDYTGLSAAKPAGLDPVSCGDFARNGKEEGRMLHCYAAGRTISKRNPDNSKFEALQAPATNQAWSPTRNTKLTGFATTTRILGVVLVVCAPPLSSRGLSSTNFLEQIHRSLFEYQRSLGRDPRGNNLVTERVRLFDCGYVSDIVIG
jgi:hypothetical protein